MAKKDRGTTLIELDHLCLAALTKVIRCDKDAMHNYNCGHTHTDEQLCAWMESFGEELETQHKKMGKLEVISPQDNQYSGI